MPVEQAISVLGTILPAKIVRFVESQIDLHSTMVKNNARLYYISLGLCTWLWNEGENLQILYLHLVFNKILYSQIVMFIPNLYFALL